MVVLARILCFGVFSLLYPVFACLFCFSEIRWSAPLRLVVVSLRPLLLHAVLSLQNNLAAKCMNVQSTGTKMTALHFAYESGNKQIVQLLLANGAVRSVIPPLCIASRFLCCVQPVVLSPAWHQAAGLLTAVAPCRSHTLSCSVPNTHTRTNEPHTHTHTHTHTHEHARAPRSSIQDGSVKLKNINGLRPKQCAARGGVAAVAPSSQKVHHLPPAIEAYSRRVNDAFEQQTSIDSESGKRVMDASVLVL